MKILITGITGFVGSHLAEYILNNVPGAEVHGTKRWRAKTDNVDHLDDQVMYHECDMKDAHNVYEIVEEVMPDKIFHLAAQSYVPASWESPVETFVTNIVGQANLFEAVKKFRVSGYDPVVLIAGSSEEYGKVLPEEIPIKETNPLRPLSPYAVSKVTQDYMGYQYFQSYGIRIIRSRAFNHEGPRRGEVFVTSNFAKQIVQIEKGKKDKVIKVGNLDAVRDFTDVRDIVRAYWLATEICEPGEVYNICTGKGYAIKEVLNKMLSFSKLRDIKVEQDPKRMRPSDVPNLVGDCSKFKNLTGWSPKIDFMATTLKDLIDYWRGRI